ncbi:MAG: DsbA family protein [Candidatus Colwellbacteria bacterium]|nr:DsbA family protein [Candidatus Colwellbacteria bacterium]
MEETNKNFEWSKFMLPGAIVLAGVLISASVIYSNGGFGKLGGAANLGGVPDRPVKVSVSADNDAFLGNKNAPVEIIEFSDFQCPFCRTFWRDTLPLIKSEYIDTGKAKFVYRDFPLQFHPSAMPAAQSAECAREQGKFWEMHDKIFGEEDKKSTTGTVQFDVSDLKKWAGQIGLDTGKFNSCLDSGKYAKEVEKDYSDGSAAGVSGTPSVFVNGQIVVGAQPFSAFKSLIDSELNK